MADLTVVPSALGPATSEPNCYIEPAEAEDVMFEQLEWLLDHADGSCPAGCRECARLETVKRLLLQPFSDTDLTPRPRPMLVA
jgi:hypothetical protein